MNEAQTGPTNSVSDADAWLDKHGNALFRYAVLRVRESSVAEDLVQETLLAALKNYDKFQHRGAERSWLIGILKHKIVDHFRQRQRETAFERTDDWFAESEFFVRSAGNWKAEHVPVDWQASPAELIERNSFWKAFDDCLTHLPTRTASAFILREVDGLKSEVICETLGITLNNLWVMLHRARLHLRSCLETNWFKKLEQ